MYLPPPRSLLTAFHSSCDALSFVRWPAAPALSTRTAYCSSGCPLSTSTSKSDTKLRISYLQSGFHPMAQIHVFPANFSMKKIEAIIDPAALDAIKLHLAEAGRSRN